MRRHAQLLVSVVLLGAILLRASAAATTQSTAPQWMQPFATRNNVTYSSAAGTVTLAGATASSGSLAPSAALISINAYDGDIQINVTISDWQILQSGYQAQVSLFIAPTNYSSLIGDYLSWSATDALGSQQHAYIRSKIYTTAIPDYTWASMVVPPTASSRSIGVAGAWRQKGIISLSRKGDQVSGFLKVGSSQLVPFASLKVPTGPVVLGLQVLYGYYYSVTISDISFSAERVILPGAPAPAPQSVWQSGNSEGAWRTLFNTRNGVGFDGSTGAVTLAGDSGTTSALAPSAALLSKVAFVGDFQINVTIPDYKILQPGYQANIALFMAYMNYTLDDYLSWPATDLLNEQQLASVRAKIYTNDIPDYTWSTMYVAGNGSKSVEGPGSWQQKGLLSLSRRGSLMSGFLQVGSSPVLTFPPATTAHTGPVVLGLQMLYGFNYSLTVASASIAYDSFVELPLSRWQTSGSESSWRSMFGTRNGVSFDGSTGAATLAGSSASGAYLAPSAGLLSNVGFDGDFQINVTITDYKILQSGYQALVSLFMAPLSYQLGDYKSWPETDAITSQQGAQVRAKIYTTEIPNYTWSTLSVAGNGTQQLGTAGSWQQQGLLSLSRRGSLMSGFLQVGSSPVLTFPPATTAHTGPVVLGLQMLYGFNYSLTVASASIAYSRTVNVPPPPPQPSPSPAPAPPPAQPPSSTPPPPDCNISAFEGPPAVYSFGGRTYEPKGVGGGGAMSGLSMSPYANLWLIGTDMGSLYRSTNQGQTWEPVSHLQMRMTTDMPFAPRVGFSADGTTLFFAPCWSPEKGMPCVAKRSTDSGLTWSFMDVNAAGATVFKQPSMPPNNPRPIRYWTCSPQVAELCYAATTGGLDRTTDKGLTWQPVSHPLLSGVDSKGSFMDSSTSPPTFYHATPAGIYKWPEGQPQQLTVLLSGGVHSFAAGWGDRGITLAYIDRDAAFCEEVMAGVQWRSADSKNATLSSCGRLWVSTDGGATFTPTPHHTYKVSMAENNGEVVYSNPSRSWDRGYGTRVYRTIITQGGNNQTAPTFTTTKVFDQVNVDDRYALWPADKLEYSGVGLDVGYWDGGYYTFAVHPRNVDIAGGSENFFLHLTRDGGATWQSPFTRFRDCGARSGGKRWSSTGLEPTNYYKVAVHPTSPNFIYAGAADIKGVVSTDGGESWRIIDPKRQAVPNSIYGFAFDPSLPSRVFIAAAKWHDWPNSWYANPLNGAGGIFVSDDAGRTCTRVGSTASTNCATHSSPCNDMNNEFLAVAYDAAGGYLYAGGHINGIARIRLGNESSWTWINKGLLGDDLWQNETIVPDIKIDPDNGDVYMLLTGNRAIGSPRNMANQPRTGVYKMPRGGNSWTLLRGQVKQPPSTTVKPWQYPTSFDVDWTSGTPGNRTRMLLTDFINNGQNPGIAGLWRTADGGATWSLRQQADWGAGIFFDHRNPQRAYAGGGRSISPWGLSTAGGWGYGGFFYSDDAGETWTAAESFPFQASTNSVAGHGSDPCKMWYATAGAGLLLGPAPTGAPGC